MSPLTQVQENAAAILRLDAYFTDTADTLKSIDVLTQKKGDLESEVAARLSSIGISVLVITPLAKLPEPTVDALLLDVPLIFQITEEPLGNKTGKSALDVACEILCLIHGAPTGIGNPRTNTFKATETPLTLVDESPTYHVNVIARVSLTPRRAQPATPSP